MCYILMPCAQDEIDHDHCDNAPEMGMRFNPFLSHTIYVDVSNNGIKFSGGETALVKSSVGDKIVSDSNSGSYANFTFIDKEITEMSLINNSTNFDFQDILNMDNARHTRPRSEEEDIRPKENGWFFLPLLSEAQLMFDWRQNPFEMIYNEHYKLAICAMPSQCINSGCYESEMLNPCKRLLHLPIWFDSPMTSKN